MKSEACSYPAATQPQGCTTFRHQSQPYFPISTAVFISLQRVLLSSWGRSLLYRYIAVLPAYVMADPVSVAGSAVGVISLAITTCQGVISYYDSWENQEQNISDAKRKIERLQSSLFALEEILPKISSSSAIAEHVKQCVLCCGEGTARLEQFLGRCREDPAPLSLKAKFRVLRQKAIFPFRKSSLDRLRGIVRDLEGDLGTALRVLQLYVAIFVPSFLSSLRIILTVVQPVTRSKPNPDIPQT